MVGERDTFAHVWIVRSMNRGRSHGSCPYTVHIDDKEREMNEKEAESFWKESGTCYNQSTGHGQLADIGR